MDDRDRFWVEETLEHAETAVACAGVLDDVHLLAMLKSAEILFEATTALSPAVRDALFPDRDEYEDLRRARNYYVHQYHRVDPGRARLTVTQHFPDIAKRARLLLHSR